MTDIKQTLATALHDEPPMTLDKAGIVRAGKRKATSRRASIGVAVVAVVGALVAVPMVITPGGASLEVAGSEPPTSISMPDPPTQLQWLPLPKPVTAERAAELTVALAASGVIPEGAQVSTISGESGGLLQIRHLADMGYKMYNEVTTSRGSGGLMIWLDTDQNRHRSCRAPSSSSMRCEERQVNGRHLVLEDMDGMMGGLRTVYAWLPDGSVVLVQSSGSVPGKQATSSAPFDIEELVNIATQPWLTF